MDRVVSSYTPTIRALRYSRQRAQAGTGADSRSLIVAMPTTPGMPSGALPGVIAEVNRVRNLVPHPVVLSAPDRVPTRAAVLAQLPGCAVAHFACHGATDSANPSRSLLVLHDHQADPLTVASLAPVNLARAQLAYLSARQTASVPANGLADEAIQLVTAFQLVGFPSVVGTLWEIHERAATTIAGEFYAGLQTSHGTLDTSNAARVLHRAVRGQRDRYPRTPFLWAGYLHAGA
jgi:CHAT domain-containing protein